MEKSRLFMGLAIAFAMLGSGCYSMQHYVQNSRGEVSFTEVAPDRGYHFREEGRYFYVLGGLIPVMSPKTDELLAKHTRKGSKIQNLKVEQQYGPIDIGVNILSSWLVLGLVQSWSVAYEGDVVEEGR